MSDPSCPLAVASVGLVDRGGQVVLQGPIASILWRPSPLPEVEIRQGATPPA
ncbi:MAG: hypothetical protein VKI42_09370 [Synechococcaceae cyanobacterium]|nr:hypothetical protein [Synechococcaceae cyanobacterium]